MDYRITEVQEGDLVRLQGHLNEEAGVTLRLLADELTGSSTVIFNLSQVEAINSLGVRNWVQFLRTIEIGAKVYLEECPPKVIMQINLVPSFRSTATVRTFYANYVCPKCDKTNSVFIDCETLENGNQPKPPECPDCHCSMIPEEEESEYFSFLAQNPPVHRGQS